MEESVFNLEPHQITITDKSEKINYLFLDSIFNIDVSNYYSLLNSSDTFKLKNIYNYLFLRSIKLNYIFYDFKRMEKNKNVKTHFMLNEYLSNYIKNDRIYAIFVINSLKHYYLP